ncbi:hypothetical protein CC86DRAFT_386599 [Ophiobolus disseminans]|uniref:Uncharacterized protein n=1 Tax=Ophiobolus disseminans TaxID=1469910 RepID=A0A6A6ZJI4_9PLEO|nr:hypothetical protein CC86DRAFT_386599 [Ophiobolus disseminans]
MPTAVSYVRRYKSLAKSASPPVQLQLSLRHRTDRDCLALLSEFSIVFRCQPVSTLKVLGSGEDISGVLRHWGLSFADGQAGEGPRSSRSSQDIWDVWYALGWMGRGGVPEVPGVRSGPRRSESCGTGPLAHSPASGCPIVQRQPVAPLITRPSPTSALAGTSPWP